ncbi:MAG: hypothetical protein AAF639_10085 [Chloroflexota bacterium]
MITDELGQALHDRSTRGISLSDEEQTQLERWYEYHDKLERQRFSAVMHMKSEDTTTEKLRSQIEATLVQLAAMTKRIQEIAAENEVLRQEVRRLRAQVISSSPIQQAAG